MQGLPDNYKWRDVDLEEYRLPTINKKESVPLQKEIDETEKLSRRLFKLQFIMIFPSLIAFLLLWLVGMADQPESPGVNDTTYLENSVING